MIFKKLIGKSPKEEPLNERNGEANGLKGIERLKWAFFQISSMISASENPDTILEFIVQEALYCLEAQRSTLFLMDEQRGTLKIQYSCASSPQNDQVNMLEEREVARKIFAQAKPFVLKESKDFGEFFKYENRKRKITSLMSIPISWQGKPIRVLSVALIDNGRRFNDGDLQFLSAFGNQASIAMENAHLLGEVRKAGEFRKTYEAYLEHIISQLQRISGKEFQRNDKCSEKLLPEEKPGEKQAPGPPPQVESIKMQGTPSLAQGSGIEHRRDDRIEERLRVEFEDESFAFTDNLSCGGAFIRTPAPMELGEILLLKLHMPDTSEPSEVRCKVIWTNKYGKENSDLQRGMGVKFLNLQPEVQKRIEDHIKAFQNKELPNELGNRAGVGSQREKISIESFKLEGI
ncbi:MAG: PilZ domain-containing protein [Deltaproteobacteria bacterium]|nr:PilZ domain-containing protein [Deltaproteobacteria bacterium]